MADDIIVRIRAEGQKQFVKDLKKAGVAVEDLGEETEKTTKKMESSFSKIGKVIGGAFVATALVDFGKQLAKTAVDIDATGKKLGIVFGGAAKDIEDFARKTANSLGLTQNEYKKAASAAGDLLIPMGFQRKEAARLSNDLIKLSGALSAWTGGTRSATEVSDILTKALLGEREQLKSLGISIQEADVKARLLEKGQSKLTGTLLQQAKANATLELIYEKTADAQAAFNDDTKTLAESQQELSASIREIRDGLAENLIPALTAVSGSLATGVKRWNEWNAAASGQKALDEINETNEALSERALILERGLAVSRLQEIESKRGGGALKARDIKLQKEIIKGLDAEIARRKAIANTPPPEDIVPDAEEPKVLKLNLDALQKTIDILAASETEATKRLQELQAEMTETKSVAEEFNEALIGDNALSISDVTQSAVDGYRATADAAKNAAIEEKASQEEAIRLEKERIELQQQRINGAQQGINDISQIQGAAFDIVSQGFTNELIALENKNKQGLISDKEYAKQKAEILTKQAKADKAQAIFQATVNTASAIVQALPNFILAGIVGALGIAQIAKIAQQPIPQFAEGTKFVERGKNKRGRDTIPAMLDEGERVISADTNRKYKSILDVIQDKRRTPEDLMQALAGVGVPVQFKMTQDDLHSPLKTLDKLSKENGFKGINFDPLLRSNEVSTFSVVKNLRKIHDAIDKGNGMSRRMSRN